MVQADTQVADFSTCERYGYTPELEIQILIEGANGGLNPIDPVLVGLEPH